MFLCLELPRIQNCSTCRKQEPTGCHRCCCRLRLPDKVPFGLNCHPTVFCVLEFFVWQFLKTMLIKNHFIISTCHLLITCKSFWESKMLKNVPIYWFYAIYFHRKKSWWNQYRIDDTGFYKNWICGKDSRFLYLNYLNPFLFNNILLQIWLKYSFKSTRDTTNKVFQKPSKVWLQQETCVKNKRLTRRLLWWKNNRYIIDIVQNSVEAGLKIICFKIMTSSVPEFSFISVGRFFGFSRTFFIQLKNSFRGNNCSPTSSSFLSLNLRLSTCKIKMFICLVSY